MRLENDKKSISFVISHVYDIVVILVYLKPFKTLVR